MKRFATVISFYTILILIFLSANIIFINEQLWLLVITIDVCAVIGIIAYHETIQEE